MWHLWQLTCKLTRKLACNAGRTCFVVVMGKQCRLCFNAAMVRNQTGSIRCSCGSQSVRLKLLLPVQVRLKRIWSGCYSKEDVSLSLYSVVVFDSDLSSNNYDCPPTAITAKHDDNSNDGNFCKNFYFSFWFLRFHENKLSFLNFDKVHWGGGSLIDLVKGKWCRTGD